ncbi:SAM-dependent methyltransferase [Ectocarpus siliculosus]|uniref:SAM-dependent methyltransferase n=1 Tax=Ectocarpus siliculosus TaxID=2880 RepID=D7FWG2_ECTSI|nr:SAM-dependent methyltransferase [Ectocarpus siliculosus]|eukprot:CBJ32050.1 SAM-dependent methyltransferase [Ectocarpus siliculosus]
MRALVVSCAFHSPCQRFASRAGVAIRPCSAALDGPGGPITEASVRKRSQRGSPVLLRDIFGTRSPWLGMKRLERAPLQRLDRLQEVADLALEDRVESGGGSFGCADIGTDHGLLAICLHANGANVIAGDRAAGPLNVARQNAKLYLRHAQQAPFSVLTTAAAERGAPAGKSECTGTPDATAETLLRPINEGSSGEGVGNDGAVADGVFPRLECRLGDGLAVLEQGEADTVCIAGVGVKTMIQILSTSTSDSSVDVTDSPESSHGRGVPALSRLGVRRLVLQPMDARLEYMRDLRVWLRENGWRITQEKIVSTLGKGGRHAFLTLRADCTETLRSLKSDQGVPPFSGPEWPTGMPQEEWSDWLGDFLPSRTMDSDQLRIGGRGTERQEASTFLAYLRHQRDWLTAIERARSRTSRGVTAERQDSTAVSEGVDSVLRAVEDAIRVSGKDGSEERLVTSRRWRRSSSKTD